MRRLLALLMVLSILIVQLPMGVFSDGEPEESPEIMEEEIVPEERETIETEPIAEEPDEFYAEPEWEWDSIDAGTPADQLNAYLHAGAFRPSTNSVDFAGAKLTGFDRIVYRRIVEAVTEIAAGERENAVVTIPLSESDYSGKTWSAEELGVESIVSDGKITKEAQNALIALLLDSGHAVRAALRDCPYEMYWAMNKWSVRHFAMGARKSGDTYVMYLPETREGADGEPVENFTAVSFSAAPGYEGAGANQVDSTKTAAASRTVEIARSIVAEHSGETDLQKLDAYQNAICSLNTYNTEAAGTTGVYGDPWQIIYVFDGDPSTNVVCEGYAKAFQYLWELSRFRENIQVYSVTGTLSWPGGSGGHMWNIVRMEDGGNYLVDVTNSDAGDFSSSQLFLEKPDSGDAENGYRFGSYRYTYDASAKTVYTAQELTLSPWAYDPDAVNTEGRLRSALSDPAQQEITVTGFIRLTEDLVIPEGKTVALLGGLYLGRNTLTVCGTLDCQSGSTLDLEDGELLLTGNWIRNGELRGNCIDLYVPQSRIVGGSSVNVYARSNIQDMNGGGLDWSLADGDEQWASIDDTGMVTAGDVRKTRKITVLASDGISRGQLELTIIPKVTAVEICRDGEKATGQTITVDVNNEHTIIMYTACLPEDSESRITWSCSSEFIGNMEQTEDGRCILSDMSVSKNTDITLTATAESGASASVRLHLIGAPQEIAVADLPQQIVGGKALTIRAVPEANQVITEPALEWMLASPEMEAYASLTQSGRLTTKAVPYPEEITVVVRSKANPAIRREIPITLAPKAVKAEVFCESIQPVDGLLGVAGDTVQLSVKTWPQGALTAGTWKSSNTAIARVNGDGLVTIRKPGTVTITFTASDGSKQSASLKLCAGNPVSEIQITGDSQLRSGSKITLRAEVNADASKKTLVWSSDSPAAAVSSKGVVTAKTVYVPETATIFARATDGSGTVEPKKILLLPKENVLPIFRSGKTVNGCTLAVDISEGQLKLEAEAGSKWTSNKNTVAQVDETGLVTISNAGNVTITAKSADGKRTGKVTLKIGVLVKELEITAKGSMVLASGKGSVKLAAVSNGDAAVKTVTWVSSDPSAATVSSTGVVKAKSGIDTVRTVRITARAKDGGGAEESATITVVPAVFSLSIAAAEAFGPVRAGEVLNGRTIRVHGEILHLNAAVYPLDAMKNVTWKSSNPRIASADPDGTVHLHKPGTVTLTAAAADGSGQKNTVKLIVE